jgi:hypothetical protein
MSAVVIDLAVERSRRLALKVAVISSSSVAVDRWLLVDGAVGADELLAPLSDERDEPDEPDEPGWRRSARESSMQRITGLSEDSTRPFSATQPSLRERLFLPLSCHPIARPTSSWQGGKRIAKYQPP